MDPRVLGRDGHDVGHDSDSRRIRRGRSRTLVRTVQCAAACVIVELINNQNITIYVYI